MIGGDAFMENGKESIDGLQDIIDLFTKGGEKFFEELGTFNLMVSGKPGVGKSTLINAVFREDFAKTAIGEPCTQKIERYKKDGCPWTIYDTPGFELNNEAQNSIDDVKHFIQSKQSSTDEAVHCLWYCVLTESKRFEEAEKKFIDEVADLGIPVIIVLTRAYFEEDAEELKSVIEKLRPRSKKTVIVLAESKGRISAYGIEELMEITRQVLPEGVQRAYANALDAKYKQARMIKRAEAEKIIKQTQVASSAAALSPIPMSDAALLIPIEISMMARITAVYGVDLTGHLIKTIATALASIGGASLAGRTIVSNLLKFIPGAGTAIGGAIAAATAAALTGMIGHVYIALMEQICDGGMNIGEIDSDKVKDFFKSEMEKAKNDAENMSGQILPLCRTESAAEGVQNNVKAD